MGFLDEGTHQIIGAARIDRAERLQCIRVERLRADLGFYCIRAAVAVCDDEVDQEKTFAAPYATKATAIVAPVSHTCQGTPTRAASPGRRGGHDSTSYPNTCCLIDAQ